MRKDQPQAAEGTTAVTEEDVSPETLAFLKANQMSPEQLGQTFDQMQAALKCLPDEMTTQLLSFYISQTLNAYGITGEKRLKLLLQLASMTDGVTAMVMKRDDDGEFQDADLSDECDCPNCTAEREAKASGQLH